MNVKTAVIIAKNYVVDLYNEEKISNLGLEEVKYNPGAKQWRITLGFSRPWDYPASLLGPEWKGRPDTRSFKAVIVDDKSGIVLSIENREFAEAE